MQILHVVGLGRSGSTLLNRMLGQNPNVIDLGEIRFFYERGVINNERCSCGSYFLECSFWSSVSTDFFRNCSLKPEELKDISYRAQRNRNLVNTFRDSKWCSSFLCHEEKLITVIEQHCKSKKLIVDTSKIPVRSHLYLSSKKLSRQVKVVHLIRDPRAVSYSWTKRVQRPETHNKEEMARFSVWKSTFLWLGVNLISYVLRFRYKKCYMLMSYEQLCESPDKTLSELYSFLEIDEGVVKNESESVSHALSGNPMRFAPLKAVKVDESWKSGLSFQQKLISSIVAYPIYRVLSVFK